MNKQEAIKRVEQMGEYERFVDEPISKKSVLNIISQIREPKKVIVPKFVADWYEDNKDNFDYSVQCLCVQGRKPLRQIDIWFDNDDNKPIVTLVKMKLFGYEVEKEKLYLASFRDTNQYLGWNEKLGEWFMSCSPFTSGVEQTQETWEGVGIWNNPAFEIKEVDE